MSDLEGYQSIDKDYYQPYTVVSCVADVAKDASDQTPLQFARISETDSELQKNREIVSIPGFTKGEVIKSVSEDMSAFRVDWVDLPVDIFKTGIPGAVFVSSRDANGSSYNITTCTLNAGWGSSTIMSTAREPDAIWSHMSNVPSSWTNDKAFLDAHDYVFALRPDFANISNFSYPQRRINISKDWIKSTINPTIVLNDNSTTNFISLALLSQQAGSPEAFQPTEMDWARLLNFLLVVAMAATGTGHDWEVFSDLKNATKTCDTCLVLEIKYSYYGWLYSAQGTAIRLAVTVMLVYCALILGHIIYSAVSGISSTAWDSTAELVALTMNSSPTEILQNTCAGIIGREAFQTPVRVLATTPGHLELVFGAAKGQNSKLVMNEKYGNLTAKKTTKSKSQSPLRRVRYGKRLLLGARNKGRLRKRSGAVDPYIRIDEVSPLQNSPTATAKKVKSADLTAD